MPLNPITTSQKIAERYFSYISTTLQLKDETLRNQLISELTKHDRFIKGPFVEITPPYRKGVNIQSLIEQKILSTQFYKLGGDLQLDRPLYLHQEKAIQNLVQNRRNTIVSTGTGSGKTEAFLIPIINYLLELDKNASLNPGVRALLLYPMNALANDQIKRMRTMLRDYANITFGIYTGETEEKRITGIEKYTQQFGRKPLNNELISREEMRESPPHILITNYAMLEYLLIRPKDNSFFHGNYAYDWKFIVIDEAHVYTGAKAVEMSMLLRRLKQFIKKEEKQFQCILTSATIGKGENSSREIASFAGKLFHEPFSAADVIVSQPEIALINNNLNMISLDSADFSSLHKDYTGKKDKNVITYYLKKYFPDLNIDENHSYDQLLYFLLSREMHVLRSIEKLAEGAMPLYLLSKELFNDEEDVETTAALIDLCNAARQNENSSPLIPARYHLFVRALEGGFFTFEPQHSLYLVREKEVKNDNTTYKAFEIGTCNVCDELFLIGQIEDGKLEQPKNRFQTDQKLINYYYLASESTDSITIDDDNIEDEDAFIDVTKLDRYKLCPSCGDIWSSAQISHTCECATEPINLIKAASTAGKLFTCPICGNRDTRNGIVHRFIIGEDAATSVLATELYLQLSDREAGKIINKNSVWDVSEKSIINRKMLMFSDSRQTAAYFSTYLEFTYQNILSKKIVNAVLSQNKKLIIEESWNIEDMAKAVIKYLAANHYFTELSNADRKNLAWNWVIRELVGIDGRNSLERLGFLFFEFDFSRIGIYFSQTNPLQGKYGFSSEESKQIYQFMLDFFRLNLSLSLPEHVELLPYMFRYQKLTSFKFDSSYKSYIKSWIPLKKGGSNRRYDYMSRVFSKKNISYEPQEFLKFIWETIFEGDSPFSPYIVNTPNRGNGIAKQLRPEAWKIKLNEKDDKNWYYCTKCKKRTYYNIEGVCPTYRCTGNLIPDDLSKSMKDHYAEIYSSGDIVPMRVQEHTAQLSHSRAAEVQTDFIKGKVNILSCSTTFELGVDVGDLETVFLKNIPPNPANYIQRAGRAGRHINSTAFILTYARLNSHDFSHFNAIERMLSGKISPPHFILKNEKIARRHIFATALAFFWKSNEEYFVPAGEFFINSWGVRAFKLYIESRPSDLEVFISSFLPSELYNIFSPWKWIDMLFNNGSGLMEVVESEINSDRNVLEKKMIIASENKNYKLAERLKRMIRTLDEQPIISLLSRKNIMPKYGFPVDVVNLHITQDSEKASQVELTRDLQIALSEYAPESGLVANGFLWKSRYIKKAQHKEWLSYSYFKCQACGYIKKQIDAQGDAELLECPICHERLSSRSYLVPEFGFIAEKGNMIKPGMKRPERTYSSRKFFIGAEGENKISVVQYGSLEIELRSLIRGKLLVVNSGKGQGFYICSSCGYSSVEKIKKHNDPWGTACSGTTFRKSDLGYEFETDVIEMDFKNINYKQKRESGFWQSILYGVLNGLSEGLEIERNDIDGCLRQVSSSEKKLILFDTVPGGAGHVSRVLKGNNLQKILNATYEIVSRCECGGEEAATSCYSCLRNYSNQFCHEELQRKYVLDFLNIN